MRARDIERLVVGTIERREVLQQPIIRRLLPILRDYPEKWEDESKWSQYVPKGPSHELVEFLADLVCDDPDGYIAFSMAQRVETLDERYSKPLAKALLDESCEGVRRLPYIRELLEPFAE